MKGYIKSYIKQQAELQYANRKKLLMFSIYESKYLHKHKKLIKKATLFYSKAQKLTPLTKTSKGIILSNKNQNSE